MKKSFSQRFSVVLSVALWLFSRFTLLFPRFSTFWPSQESKEFRKRRKKEFEITGVESEFVRILQRVSPRALLLLCIAKSTVSKAQERMRAAAARFQFSASSSASTAKVWILR